MWFFEIYYLALNHCNTRIWDYFGKVPACLILCSELRFVRVLMVMISITRQWQNWLHSASCKVLNEEPCLLTDALNKCEERRQEGEFMIRYLRYVFSGSFFKEIFLVKWKTGISFEVNNPLLARNHTAFMEEGAFVVHTREGQRGSGQSGSRGEEWEAAMCYPRRESGTHDPTKAEDLEQRISSNLEK